MKKELKPVKIPKWRVHTPHLLKEITENGAQMGIFFQPMNIFRHLLAQVGEEAARINDHELNKLMIRLTIYSIADPESEDYDKETVRRILADDMTVYGKEYCPNCGNIITDETRINKYVCKKCDSEIDTEF